MTTKSLMHIDMLNDRFMIQVQRGLVDMVEQDLYAQIRECVKEAVNTLDIKQKIEDELSR